MRFFLVTTNGKKVTFKIVGNGHAKRFQTDFDPKNGTMSKGTAICLVCGHRIRRRRKVKRAFYTKARTARA